MKRTCKNHPEIEALSFCHNCDNFYCKSCLNEGIEYYYCNSPDCNKKYLEEVSLLNQKYARNNSINDYKNSPPPEIKQSNPLYNDIWYSTISKVDLKKIKWGWVSLFLIIIIIFIYAISVGGSLKVSIHTLKNGDTSVLWIKNEENKEIKLNEVEINGKYALEKFPDKLDPNYPCRGQKYVQPSEEIILCTEYFIDSEGKKFDSYSTSFTKVEVWAEVDGSLRWFTGKP